MSLLTTGYRGENFPVNAQQR